MNNKVEWYESRRNELLVLLNQANTLNIPDKYASELLEIAKKCRENAFEIALVGEFQGGKSTTFNALCDGRDISPRGLGGGGIKTSATIISAQNIAEAETKNGLAEWAEVTFRQPETLALGMFDFLHKPLLESRDFRRLFPALDDKDFKMRMLFNFSFAHEMVNISDTKQRRILMGVLHDMWQKWQRDRASFSDDDLDQLRIATLQLKFYGTPEYNQFASETVLPINRFQQLVAFPKDWEKRWNDGENAAFTMDEIGFVFVESVLVRIHSRNLERIGCRITDCPGLFVNAYDTIVAERAIAKADGVWYLINGEKQIGEKDMKIIRKIFTMNMADKISATCNLKGPQEQKIEEILPVTKAILKNANLDIKIFPYNARFAFLAMQGNLLLHNAEAFSPRDLECMRIDSKTKTDATAESEMWVKMVKRLGSSTELEDIEEIDSLDDETVKLVRKASYLDDMLNRVEKDVIEKKAKSILVDKGSKRATDALLKYEGELNASIASAKHTVDEWNQKRDDAKQQLTDFVNSAEQVVKESRIVRYRESFAEDMADECVRLLLNDKLIYTLSEEVCNVLVDNRSHLYFTRTSMVDAILKQLVPILTERFRICYSGTIVAWRVANGGTYDELKHCVEEICYKIGKLWRERSLDSVPLLKQLGLPNFSGEDIEDARSYFSDVLCDKDSKILKLAKIKQGPLAFFHGIFSLILIPIKGIFADDSDEKIRNYAKQKLLPKVVPEIKDLFDSNEIRDALRQPFEKTFEEIQEKMVIKISDALGKLSDELTARFVVASQNFKLSQEKRDRLVEEYAQILSNQIQPLRGMIQDFEKETLAKL